MFFSYRRFLPTSRRSIHPSSRTTGGLELAATGHHVVFDLSLARLAIACKRCAYVEPPDGHMNNEEIQRAQPGNCRSSWLAIDATLGAPQQVTLKYLANISLIWYHSYCKHVTLWHPHTVACLRLYFVRISHDVLYEHVPCSHTTHKR